MPIKLTQYDDGYPIIWSRSIIPSNTLAALYALGEDDGSHSVSGLPYGRPTDRS